LQNIISGKGEVRNGTVIQAVACYLSRSQSPGSMAKGSKLYKKQETEILKNYITAHNLWISNAPQNYISEGAEQKVFLNDGKMSLS
jgi:hypothetical protein